MIWSKSSGIPTFEICSQRVARERDMRLHIALNSYFRCLSEHVYALCGTGQNRLCRLLHRCDLDSPMYTLYSLADDPLEIAN
jgi:hypothetical protein